jgi:hypothetical protein
MNTNIRIIKRSQRDAQHSSAATTDSNRMPKGDNSRHATRDITGHVTSWIKEFQQKHTPDPRRAFANLFVDAATSTAE